MHSDTMLDIMDEVTASLGDAFRHFSEEICPAYNTKELPKEANARRRRRSKKPNPTEKAEPSADMPRKRTFNLRTYKFHSLDDYVRTIRWLGTTESYSTTIVGIVETWVEFRRLTETSRANLNIAVPKDGTLERTVEIL